MADGGHFGFGHSEIRGRVAGKHLGDFLCLRTHELSSNEKFSQHHFANGSTGQVQDYIYNVACFVFYYVHVLVTLINDLFITYISGSH